MGTLKEWWEGVCWKVYYTYIDARYTIRHIPDTIERIVYYLPIIAKLHDWDGNNIVYLCVSEIERLEHYYRDKDDILADESKNEIIAELQSAKVAGHRLIDGLNGYYLDELYAKHGMPENYFSRLTDMESFYNKPTTEQKEIHAKMDKIAKDEDRMLSEAEIRFFDLIREHYKNWWS